MKKAFLEAMMANLFWGFGFTATIWALKGFSITQILFLRFFIVGLVGLVWSLSRKDLSLKKLLPMTFVPALFLVMEVLFQVWGLEFTTATNAGFLTVTYILMVPLLEKLMWKKPVPRAHWAWVAVAFVGTVIMLEPQNVTVNPGDLLMLISALGASLHMLSIDRLGKTEKNLFFANTLQSFWGALLILPILVFKQEPWVAEIPFQAWAGLASITFGSTMLAFYFQMRAQKTLSPSVTSLFFLVESPLAAGFGFALLGERMSLLQIAGGVLVLIAAAGVAWRNRA